MSPTCVGTNPAQNKDRWRTVRMDREHLTFTLEKLRVPE